MRSIGFVYRNESFNRTARLVTREITDLPYSYHEFPLPGRQSGRRANVDQPFALETRNRICITEICLDSGLAWNVIAASSGWFHECGYWAMDEHSGLGDVGSPLDRIVINGYSRIINIAL